MKTIDCDNLGLLRDRKRTRTNPKRVKVKDREWVKLLLVCLRHYEREGACERVCDRVCESVVC